jgi:hypothetical protein
MRKEMRSLEQVVKINPCTGAAETGGGRKLLLVGNGYVLKCL